MTDQMHDGKCNELLVREETIHGRGPAKAVYIPNLLPSLRFLRLVIFFFLFHYYWLLREQLFPSLLPIRITILTLTDRQLMGKLTACMRRSNSAMKLMCCTKGDMWRSWGERGRKEVQVQTQPGISLDRVWVSVVDRLSLAKCGFIKSDPSCSYLFIYLTIFCY